MHNILYTLKKNYNVMGFSGVLKCFYVVLYHVLKGRFDFFANFILQRKHQSVFRKLSDVYEGSKNLTIPCQKLEINNPLWVFWWQGEETAPEQIHICINSIRKHCKGYNIVVITQENVDNYWEIPDYINDRIGKEISFAQLSDIIRVSLISIYGGGWIDAGLLMTDDLPQIVGEYDYFTIKNLPRKTTLISNYRWTNGFMFAKKDNKLICCLHRMMLTYWKTNQYMIDYFLLDYCEAFLYDYDDECKEMIEAVPFTNERLFHNGLFDCWNDKFDQKIFDEIVRTTWCHRLTYKQHYIDDGQTFYSHVTKEYK